MFEVNAGALLSWLLLFTTGRNFKRHIHSQEYKPEEYSQSHYFTKENARACILVFLSLKE